MALRTLQFFLLELSNSIRRNLAMTIASVSTVMILIFFFGFALLFFMNFQKLRSSLASEIEMHAYLKPYVSTEQGEALVKTVTAIPHVVSVAYVSKDEALTRLKAELQTDIELSGIIENPLPAYLLIKVNDPESIPAAAETVGKLAEVDQVNFMQKIIRQFISLFRTLQRIFLGLIALILICALLVIHNTIRLGVSSRRGEIEIMKLVGASHGFISWPFVLEGAFYGLIGAGLAILFLEPSYHALVNRISQLAPIWPVAHGSEVLPLLIGLLVTGLAVGSSGSYLSVKKYLKY